MGQRAAWQDYELAVYEAPTYANSWQRGATVNSANTQAEVLERHPSRN